MTTKPKAPMFRVRRAQRSASTPPEEIIAQAAEQNAMNSSGSADDRLFEPSPASDGFENAPFPGASKSAAPIRQRTSRGAISEALTDNEQTTNDSSTEKSVEAELEAIQREGLSARQLRVALRIAKQNNLTPSSDLDAVRLLRDKGIDPFQGSSLLSKVLKDNKSSLLPAATTTTLPGHPQTSASPPPDILERLVHERDISQIQLDIAKRRRRKSALLLSRLVVFVGIPTVLSGTYFYTIATPMYATNSAFVIQQADAPAAGGGLFAGTSFGGSQDSIAVQNYLEGREAMIRLDTDLNFKKHFASENIDPIQRLPDTATNEKAYKVYSKHVNIGYDPTEGIVKMEVVAANPETSHQFSEALLQYAEERVDQLTQRKRADQMQGAIDNLSDAEDNMYDAQENVIDIQEQLGIISPEAETTALMSQITGFESELQQKQLELQQLLDNNRPNRARVEAVEGEIGRFKTLIANLRSQMTETQGSSSSLARINAELSMAEIDLQTRQLMVQQAIQTLESSRMEANRQTRYLALSTSPIVPDEAAYPRKFENTVLSFLLFSGLFLLVSLTAAVLREQLSA